MGNQDSEATIRLKTEGHEQAAQQELNVAAAQEKNADAADHKAKAMRDANIAAGQSAQGTAAAADATGELASEIGKLREELNKVAPSASGAIDSLLSLLNIAALLGAKNITLAGTYETLTGLALKFATALKTVAAGAAAVTSVVYAIGVWNGLVEVIEKYIDRVQKAAQATAQAREDLRGKVADALSDQGKASPENIEPAQRRAERLVESGFAEDIATRVSAALAGQQVSTEELLRAGAAAQSGVADPSSPGFLSRTRNLPDLLDKRVTDQLAVTMQEGARDLQRMFDQISSFNVERDGIVGAVTGRKRVADRGEYDPALAKRVFGVDTDEDAKAQFDALQAEFVRNRIEDRGGDTSGVKLPHPDEPGTREMVNVLRNIEALLAQSRGEKVHIERQYIQGGGGPRGGAPGQGRRDAVGRR